VSNNSDLKKLILREFHFKSYLGHLGYPKTLTTIKNLYYWSKLKKEAVEFVARCFDCQHEKIECKHPDGILQSIMIP